MCVNTLKIHKIQSFLKKILISQGIHDKLSMVIVNSKKNQLLLYNATRKCS